ncbi:MULTISPECIES: hypothetical protein [Chryseobacterium]|uniref:hypothetical protein n=1 Tax=Chryseobacterium TaxID=59732 RepID=UPI0004877149|nr:MULTISPECIES: hypothetical protein [Chryseobacterium]
MRNILLLFCFVLFCSGLQGQSRQFIFSFNPKKFIQENKLDTASSGELTFPLYDIEGKETKYIMLDKTSEALRKAKIFTFKGKSEDGTKLMTLTIASGKLTGSYLENGQAYYIEPLKENCKRKYKIYIKPRGEYQVGQPIDFVK